MSEATNLLPTSKEIFAAKNAVANEVAATMVKDTSLPFSNCIALVNVPTRLITYAAQQHEDCWQFASKTGVGNRTNRFIKYLSFYLILKSKTTTGLLRDYRGQLPPLAAELKCSVRTADSYLAWMKKEGWIRIENGNLYVSRYEVFKKYGIDIKPREKTIYYDLQDDSKLSEVLTTIAIAKMQDKARNIYWKKVTQNLDKYKRVFDLLVFLGADAERLGRDKEYFRLCHLEAIAQSYQEEKPGQPVYNLLHVDIEANPDINFRETTYATRMGYTVTEKKTLSRKGPDNSSSTGFNALKKRLAKKQLIEIEKDHVESLCRSRKDESIYTHRWLRKTKQTIWFRCDQLTVKLEKIYGPLAA